MKRFILLMTIFLITATIVQAGEFYKTLNKNEVSRYRKYLKKELISTGNVTAKEFNEIKNLLFLDDEDDSMIFNLAVKNNDLDMVKRMVAHDKNYMNIKFFGGESALLMAVISNSTDVVKYLVENGADVNEVIDGSYTPLLMAVCNNNMEMAKYLVSKGANVNYKDCGGETVLDWARKNLGEKTEMYKYLKSIGAN